MALHASRCQISVAKLGVFGPTYPFFAHRALEVIGQSCPSAFSRICAVTGTFRPRFSPVGERSLANECLDGTVGLAHHGL